MPDHPSHSDHQAVRNLDSKEILAAKQDHWVKFLEGMSYSHVWMANRYISDNSRDGSKKRVPTLTLITPSIQGGTASIDLIMISNEEKSSLLM